MSYPPPDIAAKRPGAPATDPPSYPCSPLARIAAQRAVEALESEARRAYERGEVIALEHRNDWGRTRRDQHYRHGAELQDIARELDIRFELGILS